MELEKVIQVVLTTDKQAYEQIIKRYYSSIYHYVYQQVGDVEVSKELCQDIFFEAYRSLSVIIRKRRLSRRGFIRLRIIVVLIICEARRINSARLMGKMN